MTHERTATVRTIRRSYYLTAMAIAAVLAGGCSQADNQIEKLSSEISELRESSKAATEKARLEQQRAACRGTVASTLMALHWEVLAGTVSEAKVVSGLKDGFQSEYVEWAFISTHSQADDAPPDKFEAELLMRFAKSPSPAGEKDGHPLFAERRSPIDDRYEYYQPVFYKNDCFACHSAAGNRALSLAGGLIDSEPYQVGDLIAIVKIRLKE